jgi:hypothetical protein
MVARFSACILTYPAGRSKPGETSICQKVQTEQSAYVEASVSAIVQFRCANDFGGSWRGFRYGN